MGRMNEYSRDVVLVGEDPGRGRQAASASFSPLEGRCSRFLSKIAGLDHHRLLELTCRQNLFDVWSPYWDEGAAISSMRSIVRVAVNVRVRSIVLLGAKTRAAFCDLYDWRSAAKVVCGSIGSADLVPVFVVPHPSGRCRWWNAAANRFQAGLVLRIAGLI